LQGYATKATGCTAEKPRKKVHWVFTKPFKYMVAVHAAFTMGYMIGDEVSAGWVPIWNLTMSSAVILCDMQALTTFIISPTDLPPDIAPPQDHTRVLGKQEFYLCEA